ncbi:MAG: phosphatase PAP2 family protein [Verrucomicrobiota bacterium]
MSPNRPRLRYIEALTLSYLGFLALVLLWRRGAAGPGWLAWLAADVLIAAAILWGTRVAGTSTGGLRAWLADLYPLPLFILLYRQSEALNRSFFAEPLDPIFFALEARLFGFQPSLSFAGRFPATALAEVLYAAYFAFYPLILGFGAWVIARDREDGRRFLGTVATVFYACFGCFLVFPVVGPRILDLGGLSPQALAGLGLTAVTPMPPTTQAGPFARLMSVIYEVFEGAGGAFPSSHVAVSCLVLREAFVRRLALRWALAGLVALLCLATVYGRYHYAGDVVAGLLVFWPLARGAEFLQAAYGRRGCPSADPPISRP